MGQLHVWLLMALAKCVVKVLRVLSSVGTDTCKVSGWMYVASLPGFPSWCMHRAYKNGSSYEFPFVEQHV